jgi:serine/threonine-protein kinase RsbW
MYSTNGENCPQEALHSCPPEDWRSQSVHTTQEMREVIDHLLEELNAVGFSGKDAFSVRLAMEEAIVNAIKHGHHNDLSKQVQIRYRLTERCLLAEVQDQGPGFHPEEVPDPRNPENIECIGGRGLFLMRCYMTWVRYNASGNRVTLCKQRSGE